MKILLTLEEYAKKEGISHVAVRKQVSAKYHESISIGKVPYILQDDSIIKNLKQINKNKNGQIRELKLRIKAQNNSNNERYIEELERQISKLNIELEKRDSKYEKKLKKKETKIDILQDQKDTMYEKFLGTLVNQKSITS
jgi:vacuolar-type H+-ATPase subunit I/STV1